MDTPKLYMVFDVESAGLHGEGFAAAGVVIEDGQEVDAFCHVAPLQSVERSNADHEWLEENVLPHLPEPDKKSAKGVRREFWEKWEFWKQKGAQLVTDCGWPVEANFLSACIADAPEERSWNGPYPLLDLSSVLLAAGKDPTGTFERRPNELPAHNPLNDARQSARILIETLKELRHEGY